MGIVHRDIKADNVLLSNSGAVQLADFGLCVFLSNDRNLTPGIINLAYRPPEMLLGSRRYDEKVDIWSIGCLLAQFFLRRPPFYNPVPLLPDHKKDSVTDCNGVGNHISNKNNNSGNRSHHVRSVTTELEQLAQICNILGPLSA
uniref:Cyclin-dependent kinase C-3 n=1 Tax=Lygus hesperus TaxID=30085 RepID=A0A0A9X2L5_LYGHE